MVHTKLFTITTLSLSTVPSHLGIQETSYHLFHYTSLYSAKINETINDQNNNNNNNNNNRLTLEMPAKSVSTTFSISTSIFS